MGTSLGQMWPGSSQPARLLLDDNHPEAVEPNANRVANNKEVAFLIKAATRTQDQCSLRICHLVTPRLFNSSSLAVLVEPNQQEANHQPEAVLLYLSSNSLVAYNRWEEAHL